MPAVFGMSITPFTAGGELDEACLRSHLRWMAAGGAGVYVCSQGSGEGHLLDERERQRVFEIAVDELADAAPVHAAGIGLADTSSAIRLGRAAARAGVDAVQVLPPVVGPAAPRATEVARYYHEVLDAVDAPVVLSHNLYLGYGLPLNLVEELAAAHPNLSGVNWSDPSMPGLARLVTALGDRLQIRVGLVVALPTVAALGVDGMLAYEPNVAPDLVSQAWEAVRAADPDAAGLVRRTVLLHEALSRSGNPRSLKAALELLGRSAGHLRSPYLPVPDDEREDLRAALRDLDLAVTGE